MEFAHPPHVCQYISSHVLTVGQPKLANRCECESNRLFICVCWSCDELVAHPGCIFTFRWLEYRIPHGSREDKKDWEDAWISEWICVAFKLSEVNWSLVFPNSQQQKYCKSHTTTHLWLPKPTNQCYISTVCITHFSNLFHLELYALVKTRVLQLFLVVPILSHYFGPRPCGVSFSHSWETSRVTH